MANNSAVQRELQDKTGLKPKTKEAHGLYAARILEKINEMSEDDWEKLSGPAQKWANEAMKAVKANEEVPEFPVDPEGEKIAKPAREAPAAAAAAPAKTDAPVDGAAAATAATGDAPAAAAKAEKPAKAAKEPKPPKPAKPPRDRGVTATLKKAMLKNMNMSVADLLKVLEDAGEQASLSTVQTIRTDFRHSIAITNEAGLTNLTL